MAEGVTYRSSSERDFTRNERVCNMVAHPQDIIKLGLFDHGVVVKDTRLSRVVRMVASKVCSFRSVGFETSPSI